MQILHTFLDWHQMRAVLPELIATGLLNTLILAAGATVIGLVVGIVLALGALSRHRVLRYPSMVYLDLFRGLPVVLTIFLLGQGLPFAGFHPLGYGSYPYGIAALGLISAAYIAEIFRSGIQAVPPGQLEAARALGMPHLRAMRIVVVPQGIRNVLPALTNQFIGTIKDSSLVYLLGFTISQRELYRIGQDAAQQTGNLSPLVAAGVMYLVLTVPLTHLVNHLDRRLKSGPKLTAAAVEPEAAPVPAVSAS
ncbi:amino acid ABC transporter permease [Planosporangium thailandense]|uniref:Amino acid ABC transporter permease n=1 Tax=Planosporangium thailandense TaxID=765197 RepID=A0ABX0XTD0_9ACTN|nr:amino acid ABC transporter permease [Planosporangium thailandense]NJC69238.1 amino acid ABC transporter permease [Planosporangium thailandense]